MSTSTLSVRLAGPDDALALVPLCAAHAHYEQIDYRPAGHAQRLADAIAAQRVWIWVAEDEREFRGYAAASREFSTLTATSYLHLDCLYVDADHRGQQLGARLLAAVKSKAKDLACTQLQCQTPDWNSRALRFYEREGATRLVKSRLYWALDDSEV
ncbi:N-acetyltransferase family protein [Chitinimonas sp.]|uniref:GNAT family N-acetyltransferase n=1 Tax=Chitinimonas sp. TaxID=1934313 RepID=UPI0035B1A54B